MKSQFLELWTIWLNRSDDDAVSVFAVVTSAHDDLSARQAFALRFGSDIASQALVAPGVHRNQVTEQLFSASVLSKIEDSFVSGQDVILQASYHCKTLR